MDRGILPAPGFADHGAVGEDVVYHLVHVVLLVVDAACVEHQDQGEGGHAVTVDVHDQGGVGVVACLEDRLINRVYKRGLVIIFLF